MERHIFKFGNSSFAFIVPKKWAKKSGLSGGSVVSVSEGDDGELMVYSRAKADRSGEFMTSGVSEPEFIARAIGLYYINGFRKLKVYAKNAFNEQQIKTIDRAIAEDCPGFEMTRQSPKEIDIEDLNSISDIDIDRIVDRLRSLLEQELEELETGNDSTIDMTERLVNRFYMLGMHCANIVQPKSIYTYLGKLNLMEDISDKLILLHSGRIKAGLMATLKNFFEASTKARTIDDLEYVVASRKRLGKAISDERMDGMERYVYGQVLDHIASLAEFYVNIESRQLGGLAVE